VQFCLKKKSMGTWLDCSIRIRRPCGWKTYRCHSAVKTPSFSKGDCQSNHLSTYTNIFCWLAIQDLYPNREVDAELSDEDNNRQKKPAGDDAEGKGAPSVEALAPNPIGSSLAGSPALQLPIKLPPPLHLPLEKGKSVLRSGLSASKTKLQPMR
jgi:hypothetical protein